MEIKATLTRKYGPLPLWAWAALLVVIYAGFMYMRSKNASASSLGTQNPKSNLGTVAGDGSGGGGSIAFPDTLPNTIVGQSAQAPPFTSPAPSGDTSAPAVAPLASADVTAFSALAPGTVVAPIGSGNPFTGGAPGGTITTDPEHNAYVTGKSDVDPFNVSVSSPVNPPDALARYLSNVNTLSTLSAPPPPPAPVTQKILPTTLSSGKMIAS